MRSTLFAPILSMILAGVSAAPAFGQFAPGAGQAVSKPLEGVSDDEVALAVASRTTIPMWRYTTTSSRDGQTYSGWMAGSEPIFKS